MFDYRTNGTAIERLGSIGFWFDFVRLATPGLLQYPNEIMRKSKHLQLPTSQQLWLHSPIDGSVERKQIAFFIFRF